MSRNISSTAASSEISTDIYDTNSVLSDELKVGGGNDDECIYNYAKKVNDNESKKNSLINDKDDISKYVDPSDRISTEYLINYERVRLLGDRTAQLILGAKPMIKGVDGLDFRKIAQLELEAKMIPIKIIRPMPNGMKEVWSLSELKLKNNYIKYGFRQEK